MAPGTSSVDSTPRVVRRRPPATSLQSQNQVGGKTKTTSTSTPTPTPKKPPRSLVSSRTPVPATSTPRRVATTPRLAFSKVKQPSSVKPAPLPTQSRVSTSQTCAAINGTPRNAKKTNWGSSSQGASTSSKKSSAPGIPSSTKAPQATQVNGHAVSQPDSKDDTVAAVPMAEAAVQLEAQVAELSKLLQSRQLEVDTLKAELDSIKEMEAPSRVHVEEIKVENSRLKARVAQLESCITNPMAQQRLSDTEKLLLSQQRAASISAPPSIAGTEPPSPHDVLCSEALPCSGPGSQGVPGTPDWDHQSLGSCSEVSVAGLQDRILQMEETHYSTSEELQATLQELADLQAQVTDLQSENGRLTDEKAVVLQSLCKQTERLEDCRARIESLTGLLCSEGLPSPNDMEARLLELIKGLQEERAEQQASCEAQAARLRGAEERLVSIETSAEHQEERFSLLQAQLDAVSAERKRLEERLEAATREAQDKSIEHDRLESFLASAKAKIEELEESLKSPGDASALEARLESARAERSELEAKAAELQEQLARSQSEVTRLRDANNSLQEECKVARNNARSQVAELEFVLAKEREESRRAVATASEQASLAQRHLEGKHQLRAKLIEAQRECSEARELASSLTSQLNEEKRLRTEENEEWVQFRCDLLMTVRVANDFKTEAQQQLESLILENKSLKERNRALDSELTRAKATQQTTVPCPAVTTPLAEAPPVVTPTTAPATADAVFSSVQQEMAAARRLRGSSSVADNRLSVKNLIESIENATKHHKASGGESHCSSGTASLVTTPTTPPPSPLSQPPVPCPPSPSPTEPPSKSPLRDQQHHNNRSASKKALLQGEIVKDSLKNSKTEDLTSLVPPRNRVYANSEISKDPLWALVRNGGSRRNALLKWCQAKTATYKGIDITNFSSSWNDGMALCALLHSYLPALIPYDTLVPSDKKRNFSIAFSAAESVEIPTTLSIVEMTQIERPDWQHVMTYVTEIYKHFEA